MLSPMQDFLLFSKVESCFIIYMHTFSYTHVHMCTQRHVRSSKRSWEVCIMKTAWFPTKLYLYKNKFHILYIYSFKNIVIVPYPLPLSYYSPASFITLSVNLVMTFLQFIITS